MKRKKIMVFLFLCLGSLVAVVIFLSGYLFQRQELVNTRKNQLQVTVRKIAMSLDKVCQDALTLADSMVDDISEGNLGRLGKEGGVGEDGLWMLLQEILLINRHFHSAAVARKPYGFDPLKRLYWRVYLKEKNNKNFISPAMDYTSCDWYTGAMVKGSYWLEPFYNEEGRHFTSYSASFYDPMIREKKGKPLGVVMITIALEKLKEMVAAIDKGDGNEYALLSREGHYLYHRDDKRVKSQESILDLANEKCCQAKIILSERIAREVGGIIDYKDKESGKKYWLVYHPVSTTGWSLQNIYLKDAIFRGDSNPLGKKLTLLIISALFFQLFLVLLLLSLLGKNRK
jgi:Cache domain